MADIDDHASFSSTLHKLVHVAAISLGPTPTAPNSARPRCAVPSARAKPPPDESSERRAVASSVTIAERVSGNSRAPEHERRSPSICGSVDALMDESGAAMSGPEPANWATPEARLQRDGG